MFAIGKVVDYHQSSKMLFELRFPPGIDRIVIDYKPIDWQTL